jgi:hypothetical protein
MAYNLPLQLLIQPPTQANLSGIRRQIESSLKGLNVNVVDTKNFAKTNAAIQNTTKQLDKGRQSGEKFWDVLEGKARSAVAYTVINTALLKATSAVSQATREAIKYEAELLKISQVTGDSVNRVKDLQKSLFNISKEYNVNISKVAQLTRTLTQTGLSFREAAKGAEVLARTSLLATFDSLTNTTEGLIAVMQTFNLTVAQGGDVLEKINAVSKAFAVESGDIVEAIRRTGGAFGSAGGQVEELIALFTSVRSTSRESAETIATGFRTIFGRLQRPKTIEYFKQLGIQLETAEGQFIGPLKAIEAISQGLDRLNISVGSTKFAEVVEQIGGIRQISRVVPLLEQYRKTQNALDIQNRASVESYSDIEKAQKGLGFQLGKLKQDFGELIAEFVNSSSFQVIAKTFIGFTRTIISLTKALQPILPILTAFATFKLGRGISQLISGGILPGGKPFGGFKETLGLASGGMVPGSGNRDTVPAMLTPGEFVMRKSAVKAFGADRLAGINKYKKGGNVVAAEKVKVIDGDSIGINYASDPYYTSTRLLDVDAYELNKGSKAEKAKGLKAKKIAEQHYSGKKDLLSLFKGYGQDKFGRPKFKDDTLAKKLLNEKVAIPYSGTGKRATGGTELEGYAIGGLVPKFVKGGAVGGEAEKPQKEFGKILLSEDATGIEAKYAANENRVGFVRTKLWKDNLYTVGLSKASRGYGPKLYDVAMEAITARGGMLTSDRATVSGDARKVWDFYFRNRSDVKKKPLPRDQWTGNYALVDEKLRGPQETWPPATDPAWALQTGYSKSPSLINDPNTVKRVKGQQSSAAMALNYFSRFANGGSVNTGTDTVPALLTPGEFVINKKSAQSFGYGNLENINRYEDGGVVGDVPAQYVADVKEVSTRRGPVNEKILAELKIIVQKMAERVGTTAEKMSDEFIKKFDKGEEALLDWEELYTQITGVKRTYSEGGKETDVKDLSPEAMKEAASLTRDILTEVRLAVASVSASSSAPDAGRTTPQVAKSEGVLSKERKKFLKEQERAKQDPSGLTRAGRREAGQLAKGKDDVDFIAVQEKWTKYIEDETKNAKEIYQAKVKQISDEGGTIQEMSAAIKEYQEVVATIKNEAQAYQGAEEQAISSRNITEAEAEVKTKEDDIKAAATPVVTAAMAEVAVATKDVAKETKTLSQKIKDGGSAVYDSLAKLNMTFAEAVVQSQTIASGLKNFAGFDVNQAALTQGQVKGTILSGASESVGKFADPKVIEGFGSQLNKVGKVLPKSLGGPVRKFGGVLLKNADKIAKGAGMAAKALNVLGYIELGGGLFDSLFSTDYSKERDNFIALGDAAGAAEAAQKAYSQEMLRSIPVIGGFVSGLASYFNILPQSLDGTGQLVVANAKLEASLNGADKEVNEAKKAFADAAAVGDVQKQRDAISSQLGVASNLQAQSADVALKQGESGISLASGAAGAAGGAIAGAAIGSVVPIIGTGLGAVAGAVVGGTSALYSSATKSKEAIIKGYELQAEASKKGAEIFNGVTEVFGSRLASESKRLAAVGGTYEDAFKSASESIGIENIEAIKKQLGPAGKNLGQNAEQDITLLGQESSRLDTEIRGLNGSLANATEKEKARTEALIAEKEAQQSNIDTMRDQIVASESARIAREKLIRQQNIQNEAIAYQTQLMKESEKAMDGFNEKARELNNIEEEMNNIGTSKLTTRQATAKAGYDPELYEKSADEIVRNREDANKIARDIGGVRGQEIEKGQQRVDAISRIKDLDIVDIVGKAKGDGEKASAEEVQEEISKRLKDQMGDAFDENDPVLKASIADYSERVSENVTNAAQAEEEARNKATQQSIDIITQQKDKVGQIANAEKKLRDMQIDLVKRQSALAQKVYDTEKEYFEKRVGLMDKVDDFLDPVEEGPGNADAILAKGNARADRDRAAMLTRRDAGLANMGLGGKEAKLRGFDSNMSGAMDEVRSNFQDAKGSDAAGAIEKVEGQIEMLSKTIADEISIEEERLNTLMESAKAQQEYTQSLYDAQGSLVRDLVTGTEEEVADQLGSMNAAAIAAQQGSFNGIPEEMKKGVFSLFDKFGDVEIPGLGMTGRDAQRNITKNELMQNFGYDEATAEKLASKAVNDRVPIDEKMADQIESQKQVLLELYDQEKELKATQNAIEAFNNEKFAQSVADFAAAVEDMKQQAAPPPDAPNAPDNQEKPADSVDGKLEEQQANVEKAKQKEAEVDAQYQEAKTAYENQKERKKAAFAERDKYADDSTKYDAMDAEGISSQEYYKRRQQSADTASRASDAQGRSMAVMNQAEEAKNAATSERTQSEANLSSAQYDKDQLAAKQEIERQKQENAINEENKRREASTTGETFNEMTVGDDFDPFASTPGQINQQARQPDGSSMGFGLDHETVKNKLMGDWGYDEQTAGQLADKAVSPTASPNAQAAATPYTPQAMNQGKAGGNGPLQVETQGQQDVTVRLPDIQGLVNQSITSSTYDTVASVFKNLANEVRSANNFEDVAKAFEGGITDTSTQKV